MRQVRWDPVVRCCHWLVAVGFLTNRLLTEPGSTVHQWVGFTVAGLVVIRLLWGLLPWSGPAQLKRFLPWPSAIKAHLHEVRERKVHHGVAHNPLAGLAFFAFWGGMLGLAFTGWGMDTDWGMSFPLQDIHELIANLLTALVVVHILALGFFTHWLRFNYLATMLPGKTRE